MRYTNWIIYLCSIVFLTSCSLSGHNGIGSGSGSNSIFSKGLSGGLVSEYENTESYTTKAPHDQVYLFAFDNSTIAEKYLPSLQAQANYLKNHPHARIMLAGHTDERGSREYNIALGERRANAVAYFLRGHGVSKNQMRVVSYGKERPVSFMHDEKAHSLNRRVEFVYEASK